MIGRIERIGKSVIVYDETLLDHIDEDVFDLGSGIAGTSANMPSGGRGETRAIEYKGQHWILRHYYRGGAVARFLDDEFLYLGASRSRSVMEWRLLDRMFRQGLPVPRPVAARFVRRALTYTADLISVRLPGVESLATRLLAQSVPETLWREVGATVALFHRAMVNHADLNAHNVQIDSQDHVFLLDFDRGRMMSGGGRWQQRNLNRLARSLKKICATQNAELESRHWSWLLEAYRNAMSA